MVAVVTALVSVDDTVAVLAAFVSMAIRLLRRVGIGGKMVMVEVPSRSSVVVEVTSERGSCDVKRGSYSLVQE